MRRSLRSVRVRGFTMVQLLASLGVLVLGGVGAVQALISMNHKAATYRILTNARAVVQRNIDTALAVPFSATVQPTILALTSTTGAIYDDDSTADNRVDVAVQRSGSSALVTGTLTRIVTAEPNPNGADVRRVTFRVDYTYRSRPFSYAMTTLRAAD
jgi:type II secretory pathway pseudopilin PulG